MKSVFVLLSLLVALAVADTDSGGWAKVIKNEEGVDHGTGEDAEILRELS